MLRIGVLTMEFHLDGCRSLKEKRQRLSGLRERLGRSPNVAVCEHDYQDSHQRAAWSFVAVAADHKTVERTLVKIERDIQESTDAVVVGVERELM